MNKEQWEKLCAVALLLGLVVCIFGLGLWAGKQIEKRDQKLQAPEVCWPLKEAIKKMT